MKSDIRTYKNGGYTSRYANNNLRTHHTLIANSFICVGMLGLALLGLGVLGSSVWVCYLG